MANDEIHVVVGTDADIVSARQKGRALAAKLGFSPTELAMIATAISELARNIVLYAKQGEIVLRSEGRPGKQGIVVVARDEGPGIRDTEQAMQAGYSTSGSLGLGLAGVRRLMDDFEIESRLGWGTVVTAKKWNRWV